MILHVNNIFFEKNIIKKESLQRGDWAATYLEKQEQKL